MGGRGSDVFVGASGIVAGVLYDGGGGEEGPARGEEEGGVEEGGEGAAEEEDEEEDDGAEEVGGAEDVAADGDGGEGHCGGERSFSRRQRDGAGLGFVVGLGREGAAAFGAFDVAAEVGVGDVEEVFAVGAQGLHFGDYDTRAGRFGQGGGGMRIIEAPEERAGVSARTILEGRMGSGALICGNKVSDSVTAAQ